MNEKLKMAVNHALSDLQIARARMALLAPSMGLDAKRSSAWCEYGFKENIIFDDLYNLYRRGGIAHGAVNKLVSTCWKTNPEIIEGDEHDNSKDETEWEKKNKRIFTNRFWRYFAEADKRRLVGRWSALLLHINDDQDWSKPVVKGKTLVKITPVWAGAIKPSELETDEKSKNYGFPKEWDYMEQLPNGGRRPVKIHPDRVFILGDYSDDAIGFLEPAYNVFVSIEKVEGGSGESFLKNASRQLSINFDKEIDFNNLASLYDVSINELQEKFNEAAKEVNQGNDVLLTTQGANVTPLVTAVADPSPTYNVNLQTVSAALDIPTKILVGMQSGERASTEDQKYMNARCQSRRNDLSFEIEDFADRLIYLKVIDAVSEKAVIWDDLNEQTLSEKLDNSEKMARINQISIATGDVIFSDDEIRTVAGYDTESDSNDGNDDGDDDDETETTDTTE